MELYLVCTNESTQGEMYAPNNIIPLSVGVRHTPNTSHISLCADMVSIKLSLEGKKKDYLLRAK